MQVRSADPSDVDDIAVVHVESWRSTYRGLVPDALLDGLSVERRKSAWATFVVEKATDREVLVLDDDGAVVGFCHFSPSRGDDFGPTVGEVNSIYLLASHWRRGGGTQLLDEALARLRAVGFDHVILWVLDRNDAARRFYETQGWSHDGVVKIDDRYSFQLRELRYARPL